MALKQWNAGSWLGAIKIVVGQAGQYVSYITLVFAAIAAYPVVSSWAITHGTVLQFWQFAVTAVVLVFVICLGEYMVGQAPIYDFWWEQSIRHAQPLKDIDNRIKRIEQKQGAGNKKIESIEQKQDKIMKALGIK